MNDIDESVELVAENLEDAEQATPKEEKTPRFSKADLWKEIDHLVNENKELTTQLETANDDAARLSEQLRIRNAQYDQLYGAVVDYLNAGTAATSLFRTILSRHTPTEKKTPRS